MASLTKSRRVDPPAISAPAPAPISQPAILPSAEALDQAYRESAYLRAFADVARAVGGGSFASGLEHFLRAGRAEILAGRRHVPETFSDDRIRLLAGDDPVRSFKRPCRLHFGVHRGGFDEALYAALFPDVAVEVAQGKLASGFDHWLECGYREIAAGRRGVSFVPGSAATREAGEKRIFELQDAEYLMTFPEALAAATSSDAPPRPAGAASSRRVEVRHHRTLHFASLLSKPYGINLFGPVGMESGLGSVARGLLQAVQAAGIAVDVWPYDTSDGFRLMPDALTRRPRFRVNLLIVNAEYLPRMFELYPAGTFDDAYNVGVWHWELSVFRPDYLFSFLDIDEVWTTSRFELNAIASMSTVPVRLVPAPVLVRPFRAGGGARAVDVPDNVFVFITILDLYSRAVRKNPLAVIAAFQDVLQHAADVALIVKFHGAEKHAEAAEELVAATRSCSQIHVIADNLTEQELAQLRARADCLISAHRSEGFGLNIAEFLACAKPVIATAYSGNTDFFDAEVGYPIAYDLVELQAAIPPYPAGYVWAEPRLASLVAQMQLVLRDRDGRTRRAAAGAARMAADFSAPRIGRIIADRLGELQLDAPKPRFMDIAGGGHNVLSATPSPLVSRPFARGPQRVFSLLATVTPLIQLAELQAMLDAAHAQTYGLWELVIQPSAECPPAVQDRLNTLRGSSPRIRVQLPPAASIAPKPGLVEIATARLVCFMQSPATLAPDTLERAMGILTDEPICDMIFRPASPAGGGLVVVRKQLLLGMGLTDLQPEEALADPFRARVRAITNLMREMPPDCV